MRKIIFYLIPIVSLAIFIVVMTSGTYLKKPRGENDNVLGQIAVLKQDLENGNWDSAHANLKKLETAWRKVIPRVQFSMERDEILSLSQNIARMKGAILARDKAGALMELYEAEEHWQGLGQ